MNDFFYLKSRPKVALSLILLDSKNHDVNYSAQSKPCDMRFFNNPVLTYNNYLGLQI